MDTDAYCPLLRVRRQNIGTKLYGYVLAKRYTSTYLHKSEYLDFGAEGNTTAFFHSKGAAFSL